MEPTPAVNGAQQKPAKRYRVYEQWQGSEKFFCYGYLVAGPNWRASLGSAALLLAPTGIFLGFVAPYLTREVHAVIMVFSCLLPALSFAFLVLTACRDPGIIPRQEPDEDDLMGRKPKTKDVLVNGHKVVIRYNETCHFYQPPRAHHCSVNDNCIERFDHHCPWVGTTIGKRNYRTFLLFVYSSTVLCMYVFGCCLAQLFVRHRELVDDAHEAGRSGSGLWGKTIGDVVPAIVLMVITFLFFWFVGGLSGFHCYLVATNQTTYENFRYNHDNRPNPYDRGILRNCAEVWCTPIPPSQVAFRAFVDEVGPGGGFLPQDQPPPHQEVEVGAEGVGVGEGGHSAASSGQGQTGGEGQYEQSPHPQYAQLHVQGEHTQQYAQPRLQLAESHYSRGPAYNAAMGAAPQAQQAQRALQAGAGGDVQAGRHGGPWQGVVQPQGHDPNPQAYAAAAAQQQQLAAAQQQYALMAQQQQQYPLQQQQSEEYWDSGAGYGDQGGYVPASGGGQGVVVAADVAAAGLHGDGGDWSDGGGGGEMVISGPGPV